MMYSLIKVVAIYSGISILLLSPASAIAQPEVQEYYPQCDYKPLDVAKVKRRVKYVNSQITDKKVANATQFLIKKLLRIASDQKAQAVLLIDREIDDKNADYFYLSFTAQLVTLCEPVQGYAKKLTPYNKFGVEQHRLNIGVVKGWEKQINVNVFANQRQSPTITNRTISASTGFFGIALESAYSQVIEKLGTPTFAMQFNERQQLLAYGRDIWLTFKDNKLVHVTNQNIWLSRELVNMLDFDERFEEQDWQLEGKITNNQAREEAKRLIANSGSSNKLKTHHDKSTLHIHTEASRNSHTKVNTNKVTGFTLELSDSAISLIPELPDSSGVTQVISTYINDTDRDEILIEQLKAFAIGRARIDSTSELLFYDNHLVVAVRGTSINKLHYIERVFAEHSSEEDQAWIFNRVSQGQSLEKVMQILGSDAFNFDDTVEVDAASYTKKLFFEQINGQNKLIAAEVSVY
jgi:hypothetical protein